MPELPDVESARHHISELCVGHKIVRVEVLEQGGGVRDGIFDELVYDPPTDPHDIPESSGTSTKSNIGPIGRHFVNAMLNKVVTGVNRRGKQLWFTFSPTNSISVLFHFGMTGSFVIKDHIIPVYKSFSITPGKERPWPPKFTKCEIEFDNKICLAFCDARRLGRIKLRRDPLHTSPIKDLALDPYCDPMPSPQQLRQQLQQLSAPIKAVLLDQERIFSGIGNYLADEILYQAGIHPETKANQINEVGLKRLIDKTHSIIHTAISVDADCEKFPKDWLFHYRWNKAKSKTEKIVMPNGDAIVFETHGGRTSAIVPKKQTKSGDYHIHYNGSSAEVGSSTNDNDDEAGAPTGTTKKTAKRMKKEVKVAKAERTSKTKFSQNAFKAEKKMKKEMKEEKSNTKDKKLPPSERRTRQSKAK